MKHNQYGAGNMTLFLGLSVTLMMIAVIFGVAAYSGEQKSKTNVDGQIATAVAAAKQQQSATDTAANAKANESPLQTYNGPEAYGSIVLQYPKTWSSYINSTGTGSTVIDGYFFPGILPAVADGGGTSFALRIQVINQAYAQVVQGLSNGSPTPTVTAYSLPKVPQVVGVEVTGALSNGNSSLSGTMIALPVRADTLEIWTEGNQYLSDFDNNILPNFSFSP